MAFPVLSKTWKRSKNHQVQPQGSVTALHKRLLRVFKNRLIDKDEAGVALNLLTVPMTVARSSDATSVADSDLWTADNKVNWDYSSNPRSWIVLNVPGISATAQLLLACQSYQTWQLYAAFSPTGYSGGTTSVLPTAAAADSRVLIADGAYWPSGQYDATNWVHIYQTSDGQQTHAIIATNGWAPTHLFIGKPGNPRASWPAADQWIAYFAGLNANNADLITIANFYSAANFKGRIASTDVVFYLTGESRAGTLLTAAEGNPLDLTPAGEYHTLDIGLHCPTAPARGRIGTLVDVFWVPPAFVTGETLEPDPDNPTRLFTVFGDIVLPNDGTVTNLS